MRRLTESGRGSEPGAGGKAVAFTAELQGLYGPFTVSELLLQKIWGRRDFSMEGLRTVDGEPVRILRVGEWNRQEGPDFRHAEIEVGGRRLVGDVEIHFYARDWRQHGHGQNPDFNRVILQVALFPPGAGEPAAVKENGERVPTLVLLPYLARDVEDYALEEALLMLEGRDRTEMLAPFLRLSLRERRDCFREKARQRWEQKLSFARKRVEKLGWGEACHHALLEVLGYRRNRVPMLELAARFPLRLMAEGQEGADYYFSGKKGQWKLAGIRPANHPRRRLEQYLKILKKNPRWPDLLEKKAALYFSAASGEEQTGLFRKETGMRRIREWLAEDILGGRIGGSRLDTIVVDAVLPLLAAGGVKGCFAYWFHWFGGDVPDAVRIFLKDAGITDGRRWPHCNGWNQGALKVFMETDGL